MDCTLARQAMLEADLPELSPGPTSDLSRHLETCEACRRAAAEILRAERSTAEWLAAVRPRTSDAEAVARAASAARRRSAARSVAWRAAPVLAAAAVAALLLIPHERPLPMAVATPTAPAPGFSVTAPPGRDVVVLHTQNPKIVVVWYVPSRRSS